MASLFAAWWYLQYHQTSCPFTPSGLDRLTANFALGLEDITAAFKGTDLEVGKRFSRGGGREGVLSFFPRGVFFPAPDTSRGFEGGLVCVFG